MKRLISGRMIILAGSLLLQPSTLCFQSRGAAGDVDLSFNPGSGANGPVRAVVVQPDGKLLIGGQFATVKGLAGFNVVRRNAVALGLINLVYNLACYEQIGCPELLPRTAA